MTDEEFERQNRELQTMLRDNAEARKQREMQEFLRNNIAMDNDVEIAYKPEKLPISEKILFYLKAAAAALLITGFAALSYMGAIYLIDKHHDSQVMDVAKEVAPYFLRDVEIGLDHNNPNLYYYRNDVAAEQILEYDGAADIHSTLYSYYVQYNYQPTTQLDEVITEISNRVRQNPNDYSEELQALASCKDLKGYFESRGITDYATYEDIMDQIMLEYADNQDLEPSSAQGGRK